MSVTHDFLVGFSKSFGLFYLLALSAAVVIYAYWPSNKKRFDQAAHSILADEDKPIGTSHIGTNHGCRS
jgi:cytochrome c oxidase cbb3-type subunit IV